MELEGDSNEVSGSPTTRSPSQFMDYEMCYPSLSPPPPPLDFSFLLRNSLSPDRRPQSPEFEISQRNVPSPSILPSPEHGFSLLISSYGYASFSTQPLVRSPSPPFREQGVRLQLRRQLQLRLLEFLRCKKKLRQLELGLQLLELLLQPYLQLLELLLQPYLQLLELLDLELLDLLKMPLLELLCLQLLELLRLLKRMPPIELHLELLNLELLGLCLQLLDQEKKLVGEEKKLQELLGLCQEKEVCEELARFCSLSNKKSSKKRELHKFIQNVSQNVSQITVQIKFKMAHEICKEGHDNASIEILDNMTVVSRVFNSHFSWTKAPCRHRSQNNASDLKKSCTSFYDCYKHQDCMSTVKLEICVYFFGDDMEIFQKLLSSHKPFFCSEYTLVRYGGKIESQGFRAICEPIASADDEPDSRCELTHISHCTRSPPGPHGLPDGEEMPQQDSPKHQLGGETHAMNDGENVLSEGGIHSAVSYPENEGTRKTRKRKITIEDLQHFSGSRNDAANHFGVSVPTIKHCLRDHKINDWRNRNIDKNNQCLCEPKEIMESFPGEEAEMGNQMAGGSRSCEREFNHEQIGSDRSQIGVGLMEESSTRLETNPMANMFSSLAHELCVEAGDHSELPVQPSELNLSATRLEPDAVNSTLAQIPERELLMENSGSSRELSDHYISATEAFNAKQVPDSSWTNLSCSDPAPKPANSTAAHMMQFAKETQDTRIVTVKAKYRDDTVKFKLPLTSGIIELKKEVAKKHELEVDSFSIKYLDDENEWIVMKDDVDLQQCFNDSISLGRNIRLLIHNSANSGAPDKAKGDRR